MASFSPSRASLKRFEVPINRFTKTALPLYLELLEKHHKNITKHQRNREWDKAKTEISNAQRTAAQLKAALEEMELVREQLSSAEAVEFDKKFSPYKNQALAALSRVLTTRSVPDEDTTPENEDQVAQTQLTREPRYSEEEVELERRKVQLETYKNLQADIGEIHQLITDFADQVHEQGSAVTQVEEHVETAAENIVAGEKFLAKAAKIKSAVYPLTGAFIGGCLAGPVGLVAGLKIGGLAAVGGTVLGFTSGQAVKKFYEKKTETSQDRNELPRSASLDLEESVASSKGLTKTSSMM